MIFPRSINSIPDFEDSTKDSFINDEFLNASRKRSRSFFNKLGFPTINSKSEDDYVVNKNTFHQTQRNQNDNDDVDDEISNSIQKGREALYNAEQHMKIFESYLNRSAKKNDEVVEKETESNAESTQCLPSSENNSSGNQKRENTNLEYTLHDNKTSTNIENPNVNNHYDSIADVDVEEDCRFDVREFINSLVSETTEWDNVSNSLDEKNLNSRQDKETMRKTREFQRLELEKLIKRREKRILRDIQIAEDKEEDKSIKLEFRNLMEKNLPLEEQDDQSTKMPKKIDNKFEQLKEFDPSKLYGAKRAALKAAKRAKYLAIADEEASQKTNFKARPLPGGIWVKNDPYALTKSAIGKTSIKQKDENYDGDNSSLINVDDCSMSIASSSQRRQSRRLQKWKQFYEILTLYFEKTSTQCNNIDNTTLNESFYEEDKHTFVVLNQNIAHLQAALNQKRSKCMKLIEALGTRNNEFEDKNELENIINKLNESLLEKEMETTSALPSTAEDGNKKAMNLNSPIEPQQNSKRDIDPTPKDTQPVIKRKPWSQIKAEHDKIEKAIREKEKALEEERKAKEKKLYDENVNEVENLKKTAKEKKKKVKCGINKKKQDDYTEKLSKPRNQKVINLSNSKDANTEPQHDDQPPADSNCQDKQNKSEAVVEQPNKEEEKLLADLNDKEFAQLVKKLGIVDSKKKKGNRANRNTSCKRKNKKLDAECNKMYAGTFKTNEDINIRTNKSEEIGDCVDGEYTMHDVIERSQHNDPTTRSIESDQLELEKQQKLRQSKEQKTLDYNAISRMTLSVDAQTKIMAKIKKSDSHEINVANARSAVDALDKELDGDSVQLTNNKNDRNDGPFGVMRALEQAKASIKEEPYERYEKGKVSFYDRSSSAEKGRFRVRDARDFIPGTMRRKAFSEELEETIMLLVGKRDDNDDAEELTITIMFDRSQFTEKAASEWWHNNRKSFVDD